MKRAFTVTTLSTLALAGTLAEGSAQAQSDYGSARWMTR